MIPRILRFVATAEAAEAAPPASEGVETIVLDTSWTAPVDERADLALLRPLRPLLLAVLREHQPYAEALRLIDGWAAESDIANRLEVDGFSLWYRRRLVFWRGLHDRLIWRWVLAALAAEGPIAGLELTTGVPELRDVAARLAAAEGWTFSAPEPPRPGPPPPPRRRLPWPIEPILWRLGLHPTQRGQARERTVGRAPTADKATLAARTATMVERARALGGERPRLLVLTSPATHQSVAVDGATVTRDPFLGPIVEALHGTELEPIVLEVGGSLADDAAWAGLQSAGRERVIVGSVIGPQFDDPADVVAVEADTTAVRARLAADIPPMIADGLDLAGWIRTEFDAYAAAGLAAELRQVARIGRFLAVVRPAAVLLINEYSRPEWIVACRRAGVPIVAVQHGIIHPLHCGYVLPSRAGLPLVDQTHLFGAYESRLLTGSSVYRPDEIVVSGSPRLDLVAQAAPDNAARAAIRTGLGVGPGERLVVFSSTSSVAVRTSTIAAAFDALLDRAWRDVHLVVKLHPAEDDSPFYQTLIEGIARARGFEPPPVTIVKAIDLFELLRAADAHLGIHSTVLTDAVAAGTPNLIVTSVGESDLIGYVAAGVARPVRDGGDLLAALDSPEDPTTLAAARTAFLADHFEPGSGSHRIAADLLARYGGSAVR
jgi:hypothetical protein